MSTDRASYAKSLGNPVTTLSMTIDRWTSEPKTAGAGYAVALR